MSKTRSRTVVAALGALSVLAVFLGLPAAGSGGTSSGAGAVNPQVAIRWTSFAQDGQDLVWRVRLQQPFWPDNLARDQQSLCLLIERAATGDPWGELCVTGHARHSTEARLEYMTVTSTGAGAPHVVSATVTRTKTSELIASFLPSAIGVHYRGSVRWQVISTLRAGTCAPNGTSIGCYQISPTKPTLVRFHVPVLVGCVASGPSLVFAGSRRRHEIALTFDDGPWNDPPTIDFLRLLEREHVVATFFEIGDHIPMFDPSGALERRMLRDGDMIGDHTWTHPVMTALSSGAQRSELVQTIYAIRHATHGFTPCLWRPPYGAMNGPLISLARSLGMLTIYWDIDPRDWSLPGVGAIYSNVVDNAHNGAIPLQHFGGGPRYETLEAVPQEISTLRKRGYQFVTVTQLLGLKLIYR